MSGPATYALPPRRAIDGIPHDLREKWRTRYLFDDGAEMRVMAIIERVQNSMRGAGIEVTIRTLWMELADQFVLKRDADVGAAAALAGIGCGLLPT